MLSSVAVERNIRPGQSAVGMLSLSKLGVTGTAKKWVGRRALSAGLVRTWWGWFSSTAGPQPHYCARAGCFQLSGKDAPGIGFLTSPSGNALTTDPILGKNKAKRSGYLPLCGEWYQRLDRLSLTAWLLSLTIASKSVRRSWCLGLVAPPSCPVADILWCDCFPQLAANPTTAPSVRRMGASGRSWNHRCGPYRQMREARHAPDDPPHGGGESNERAALFVV
jgi:hypothetical protein